MRLIKTILITTAVALLCQGGMAAAQDGGKKKKKEKTPAQSSKADSKEMQARLERILIDAEKLKAIEDWDFIMVFNLDVANEIKEYFTKIDCKDHVKF